MKIHTKYWITQAPPNCDKHVMLFVEGELSCPAHPPKGSRIFIDYGNDRDATRIDFSALVTDSYYTLINGVLRPEIKLLDTSIWNPSSSRILSTDELLKKLLIEFETIIVPNLKAQGFTVSQYPEVDRNPLPQEEVS